MKGLRKNSGCRIFRSCCLFLFITIFPIIPLTGSEVAAADYSSIQSKMYNDKTFAQETYLFTPFDNIYITVDFQHIHPGTYNLSTDWKTPWGSLEHQSNYTFTIQKPILSYKLYSWLNLWKNGPFKRVVSGEEFNKEFYGIWEVIMYLNGKQVVEHQFNVQ